MKNHKDKHHHNDVTTNQDASLNKYFSNTDCKKSSCSGKACNCGCNNCDIKKCNDTKKCECNCNDCHCDGSNKGDCCN